jgi:acyl-CoA thioester hydrolase
MTVAFSWLSPVFFDELDVNGSLHNSRFAVHVERAQSALFERLGMGWNDLAGRDPDLRYAVRVWRVWRGRDGSAPELGAMVSGRRGRLR